MKVVVTTRRCTLCRKTKPIDEFYFSTSAKRWRASRCKACVKSEATRRARENPKRRREVERKSRYGITPQQFDALKAKQAGACAICQEIPDKALCVDHDHDTGAVRGLLCTTCNVGLAMLGDSPVRLLDAVEYLCA